MTQRCFVFLRLLLFALGFNRVTHHKYSIKDFIADYKPIQDTTHAAIAVSNHSSWLDMFVFLAKPVSFLSKDSVAHAFFIGMFAIARQSIFLNRESSEDREKIMELIQERARLGSKGLLPQLLIFPEGTVSNGRTLIKFKKGAFCHTKPIKIYIVKYNGRFVSSISNTLPLPAILLTCLQFWNSMDIYEVEENLDPLFIYKKHGIDYKTDPEAWKVLADEIKDIMSFMSGMESSEDGYRDIREMEKIQSDKFAKVNFCCGSGHKNRGSGESASLLPEGFMAE